MSFLDHPREISVTEAPRRGVAGVITDAEAGDILVARRNKPVAAIVSIRRVERTERMPDELRDLTLAMSRVVTDDGARISFDDVLTAYGPSRAGLDDIDPDADDGSTAG